MGSGCGRTGVGVGHTSRWCAAPMRRCLVELGEYALRSIADPERVRASAWPKPAPPYPAGLRSGTCPDTARCSVGRRTSPSSARVGDSPIVTLVGVGGWARRACGPWAGAGRDVRRWRGCASLREFKMAPSSRRPWRRRWDCVPRRAPARRLLGSRRTGVPRWITVSTSSTSRRHR
jgi:hypothetical protein